MYELSTEFYQRIRRAIGEDSSTNPITGFQNHRFEPSGIKLAPSGQTCGPSANDHYIDGFFRLHQVFPVFSLGSEPVYFSIFRQFESAIEVPYPNFSYDSCTKGRG